MVESTSAVREPVSFGICGLGGYAGAIRREFVAAQKLPNPSVRLIAVCDPDLVTNAVFADEMRAMGVQVFDSLEKMLAAPIEAVWLPVPIPLHRSMTEKSLAAGKAVMCEKPAAGTVDDVDAMTAARDVSGKPAAIGFQTIYDPLVIRVKKRILSGEIGRVKSATVVACWRREDKYYNRNNWAGAIQRNGVWVLDSPANNALSHYINLSMFLLGSEPYNTALSDSAEVELYRARPIENYDTIAMRLHLPGGIPLLILFTHACSRLIGPVIDIVGETGSIHCPDMDHLEVITPRGKESFLTPNQRPHMIERFANLIRGVPDERAVATLEVAREQVAIINGASEASPVYDVPADLVEVIPREGGSALRVIKGVEDVLLACASQGKLPHELGRVAWARPAGQKDLRGYKHFAGPANA